MNKLIEVPARIGETVYFPDLENNRMDIGIVCGIDIDEHSKMIYVKYESGLTFWHSFSDFDVDTFTDKDAAYKYLRENAL